MIWEATILYNVISLPSIISHKISFSHTRMMIDFFGFVLRSYMFSLVSYKDHIWFLWSHWRISHFQAFFFVSWTIHLRFLGFHARDLYENFDFIQGSYMISLVSYKDHTSFLWSHKRIIHFFKHVFFSFQEWSIYDFLDFMLGSCMKTWISYKDHIWFLWFHTKIIYDFFDLIQGSYTFLSVYSCFSWMQFLNCSSMISWISC